MVTPSTRGPASACCRPDAESATAPLWRALREGAALAARREPALAGLFAGAILGHDCLGAALTARLAVKLADAAMPAESLAPLFAEAFSAAPSLLEGIAGDLEAGVERNPAIDGPLEPFLYFKGFHGLATHRVAHRLWRQGRRQTALFLQSRASEVFAMDIHPAARLGRAVFVDHATGLVIGETAVVGDEVSILQEVTLGGTGKESGDRHPKVGDGVLIGAGAKIIGNIAIGRGAKVGAGSVVLHPVPAYTTVAGVPARVVRFGEARAPARLMDHSLPLDG